ncbi:hypothetical protein Egran_01263 [Elaphomyces granulatus]|uniref:glycogenin glucosyltransferase n=1 Tax=Elaphomyces granulatus TaxID=519963 RepID=A0A232M3H8_9EURO|nr:hypothetical protein Egran_01263 [Elaphomyces granulatus]
MDAPVYCTLLMSDHYLPGAMVLAHSLRDNGTKAKLVALVTLESLSDSTVHELKSIYDEIIPVHRITNRTPANLYLMNRPDLISTFTKIELWRQTQFSRIVYLDCDIVALRAPDELLSLDTHFAAVPDVGWPDCFNSGVMVLRPNMQDYHSLRALAERGISFDGADQGLFNMHFKKWHKLSFIYNCTPSANYQYIPAYKHFESTISLLHYIGSQKPWTTPRHTFQGNMPYGQLLGRWWAVYDRHYHPQASIRAGDHLSIPKIDQTRSPIVEPARQPSEYDRHYRPQASIGAGDHLSIPKIDQTRPLTIESARQPFGVSRQPFGVSHQPFDVSRDDAPMGMETSSDSPHVRTLVFHAADTDEPIAPPEASSYNGSQDSAISFGDRSDIPESTSSVPFGADEPKVSVVPPYHSTTAKRVALPGRSNTPPHPSQVHGVDEWYKPAVPQAIAQHHVARETAALDTKKVPAPLGYFHLPKPSYVPFKEKTQSKTYTPSPQQAPTDAVESRFFDERSTESSYADPMQKMSTFHEQHKSHSEVKAYSPVRSAVPQYVCGEEHVSVYFQPIHRQLETPPPLETDWYATSFQPPSHLFQQTQQHGNVPIPDFPQLPGEPSTPYARPFSPPKMEWDAARGPPPLHSKPEAGSLHTQRYTMSEDTSLFQPPTSYPEPPKDMYYKVPDTKPEPQNMAKIFPWEGRLPKATRVFPEDAIESDFRSPPSLPQADIDDVHASVETPMSAQEPHDLWRSYPRSNVWDEVPEISKYVEAFQRSRKGNIQVIAGPARPGIKITDFPTEAERPSLPVTPAPIRKSFRRGRSSMELPAAEGVPNQEDWNPLARLEELQRRQFELFEKATFERPSSGN